MTVLGVALLMVGAVGLAVVLPGDRRTSMIFLKAGIFALGWVIVIGVLAVLAYLR